VADYQVRSVITSEQVSAVIVTRGDVPLSVILDSLPRDMEKVIWDNSQRDDLQVFGRYQALEECERDVVLVQDDDVVLHPETIDALLAAYQPGVLVANMPQKFRDTGRYEDTCLLGFGSLFDKALPSLAFGRFTALLGDAGFPGDWAYGPSVLRECDSIFSGLTPTVLIDAAYSDRDFASAPNRLWMQPGHAAERERMRQLVRQVRDAA
jgi:hypothetical protein